MACSGTTAESADSVVACSLTSESLAAQAGRWHRLAAAAMQKRIETAEGLRISFRPEPGVHDELRQLVATENECCPWAEWNVTAGHSEVVLDVRAEKTGVATLHGMFSGLQSAADTA
ncbi:MAG: hypothetical protein ACTHJW_06270 [Streptosporangiaceae bacterium]